MLFCIIVEYERGRKKVFGFFVGKESAKRYLEIEGWKPPTNKGGTLWQKNENGFSVLASIEEFIDVETL